MDAKTAASETSGAAGGTSGYTYQHGWKAVPRLCNSSQMQIYTYIYVEDFMWETISKGCSKCGVPQVMNYRRKFFRDMPISYDLILIWGSAFG